MPRALPFLSRAVLLAPAFLLAACLGAPSRAPYAELPDRDEAALPGALPAMNRFGPATPTRPQRANAEIARDILDLSFAMESGRQLERMSRFEGPITVTVAPGAPPTLIPDLDQLLARLRSEAGIDITRIAGGTEPASITIETMPRQRMQRAVPQAACFVVPRVSSWRDFRRVRGSETLDWTTLERREQVAVFIPSDVPPQEIRDCLHEEVAQALGPLNDLYRLQDSVFNDDNFNAVLTGFDMLVLRAYYDDALRAGMTRQEAATALRGILARLNPRGEGRAGAPLPRTPRSWIDAVETALGPGSSDLERVTAARQAVRIAEEAGWRDGRLGFSHFALGRLTLAGASETSISAFQRASAVFDEVAPSGIQAAHVDMQLAAFALSGGRPQEALSLADDAIPAATAAQNAALLSTLLMIRAEALDDLGQGAAARATRLDSLAWGRYAFGSGSAVGERLVEVASLSPGGR